MHCARWLEGGEITEKGFCISKGTGRDWAGMDDAARPSFLSIVTWEIGGTVGRREGNEGGGAIGGWEESAIGGMLPSCNEFLSGSSMVTRGISGRACEDDRDTR